MKTKTAVEALSALAHEQRLRVFRLLVKAGPEGLPAGRIGTKLRSAPSSLSFHLKELDRAGLVTARPDGRFVIYSANFPAMDALVAYLTENCCAGSRCA
jgi:ArsR family transcriptional regulator, arsenate/arsenite/antimonite-responsive transcriptional repressor